MRLWRFFLITMLLPTAAAAQQLVSFGPGINRYGVAAAVKYHRNNSGNSPFSAGDLLLEIGNIQHPREVSLINNALQGASVYKFGKINYAWTARPYYMARYELAVRQDKKSIGLNAVGGLGVPMAYVWPVYIKLFDPQGSPGENFAEVRYDPEQHKQPFIGGRAPFSRGLAEGSVVPGVGLNAALEFIWGNYVSDVKIITLGMRLEAYSRRLPLIYVSSMNQQVYSMFYLTFAFGINNQ